MQGDNLCSRLLSDWIFAAFGAEACCLMAGSERAYHVSWQMIRQYNELVMGKHTAVATKFSRNWLD